VLPFARRASPLVTSRLRVTASPPGEGFSLFFFFFFFLRSFRCFLYLLWLDFWRFLASHLPDFWTPCPDVLLLFPLQGFGTDKPVVLLRIEIAFLCLSRPFDNLLLDSGVYNPRFFLVEGRHFFE